MWHAAFLCFVHFVFRLHFLTFSVLLFTFNHKPDIIWICAHKSWWALYICFFKIYSCVRYFYSVLIYFNHWKVVTATFQTDIKPAKKWNKLNAEVEEHQTRQIEHIFTNELHINFLIDNSLRIVNQQKKNECTFK